MMAIEDGISALEQRTGRTATPQPMIRTPMNWERLAELGEPPPRSWAVSHWLGAGVTLLAGRGGIGKTLIAQTLATALALGRNYVDAIERPNRVLFWACEDDHDELWRRQVAICRFFGVSMADLQGRLIIEPRLGMENCLFSLAYGAPVWTPLKAELASQIHDYDANVTILDNVGQTFGARENERHHVTTFTNGLTGIRPGRAHSIIALSHPGKQDGSEYSGSTAWENSVRMRWYMGTKLPDQTDEEGIEPDPDVRFLAKRKTNYSIKDYRKLTYRAGVFQPEMASGASFSRYNIEARNGIVDAVVLRALDEFAVQGIRATEGQSSPDYLPKKIRAMKLAQDCTHRELIDSMNRLRLDGQIAEGRVGTYDNRSPKIGLVHVSKSAQT